MTKKQGRGGRTMSRIIPRNNEEHFLYCRGLMPYHCAGLFGMKCMYNYPYTNSRGTKTGILPKHLAQRDLLPRWLPCMHTKQWRHTVDGKSCKTGHQMSSETIYFSINWLLLQLACSLLRWWFSWPQSKKFNTVFTDSRLGLYTIKRQCWQRRQWKLTTHEVLWQIAWHLSQNNFANNRIFKAHILVDACKIGAQELLIACVNIHHQNTVTVLQVWDSQARMYLIHPT